MPAAAPAPVLPVPRRRRPVPREVRRADGTSRWQVRFIVVRGDESTRRQESFATRQAAEAFCDLFVAVGGPAAVSALDAADAAAQVPTLRAWFREYLAQVASYATPGTVSGYDAVFRHHIDGPLGGLLLTQVTRKVVVAWVAQMRDKTVVKRRGQEPARLSSKTIREAQRLLSQCLKHAVTEGVIATNPAHGVRVPSDDVKGEASTFLTLDELALVIESVTPRWRPFVTFLAATGTRFGEATALQVRDLDLTAPVPVAVVCRAWKKGAGSTPYAGGTKGSSTRTVALPRPLAHLLTPLVQGKPADALVFTSMAGSRIQSQHFSARVWRPALERAQAQGLTKRPRVHDLRHTHASLLLGAGVPIIAVQRRLGHRSITTTVDTYGHLTPDAYAAATDAAEAIVTITSPAVSTTLPSPTTPPLTPQSLSAQMTALQAQLTALAAQIAVPAPGQVTAA